MTNEERQKLCEALRSGSWGEPPSRETCDDAADELERLAKDVAFWKARWRDTGEQANIQIERLEKEVARLKDEYGVLLERTTNMLDMMVR
jgi:hypothetical protein